MPEAPYEEREQVVFRTGSRPRTVGLVGFLVALVLLGVLMFVIPQKARPWLALVVVLGAVVANGGYAPIEEFKGKVYRP